MAIAVAQTVAATTTGSSSSVTTAAITTQSSGSVLIACYSAWSSAIGPTVSDSKSNTWTQIYQNRPDSKYTGIYYVENATGGASHTFTLDNTAYSPFVVLEITGAKTSGALDKDENGTTASGPTARSSPTTATTAQADELLLGLGANVTTASITQTSAGGWTTHHNYTFTSSQYVGLIIATQIVSSTGTYDYDYTLSGGSCVTGEAIATWEEAAAAPAGGPPPALALLGVGV